MRKRLTSRRGKVNSDLSVSVSFRRVTNSPDVRGLQPLIYLG